MTDPADLVKEGTDGELQAHGGGVPAGRRLAPDAAGGPRPLTFPVVLGVGRRRAGGTRPTASGTPEGRITAAGVSVRTYDLDRTAG